MDLIRFYEKNNAKKPFSFFEGIANILKMFLRIILTGKKSAVV